MKEIPVLYSTLMVQGILEDKKTNTRRTRGLNEINENSNGWEFVRLWDGYAKFCEKHNWTNERHIKCPYGQSGDLLWVRESFSEPVLLDGTEPDYLYKTSGDIQRWGGKPWKPSIHMPKTAARIWLEVTNIKVERLHDISEEDAKAEGAEPLINMHPLLGNWAKTKEPNHRVGFAKIWMDINGEESWKANPWIWGVEFKVLSKTGRPVNYSGKAIELQH